MSRYAWIFGCLLVSAGSMSMANSVENCSVQDRTADLSFDLTTTTGEILRLSDLEGRVILIDFWATWCGPCRIEIPGFVELNKKYGSRGLSIVGISVDDPVPAILRFAEQYEVNYPMVAGVERDDVKAAFGPLVGYPTTVLVTRDGRICHSHAGFSPLEKFEAEILSLL